MRALWNSADVLTGGAAGCHVPKARGDAPSDVNRLAPGNRVATSREKHTGPLAMLGKSR